jgi:hypothetical protein
MKKTAVYLLAPIISMIFLGCEKIVPNDVSPIPEIEIQSVAPTLIEEFSGTVKLSLKYTDGDGDLGFEHPDSVALEVWDSRLSEPDWYYIPPLSPLESNVSIEGVLDIELNGTFILGNGFQETTYFTVRLRDRSGNWSNTVQTPEITITEI